MAQLAFANLTDLGAATLLLRRGLDLLLGSVLSAFGRESTPEGAWHDAASALAEAGFWSPERAADLQRLTELTQRAAPSAVASRAERAAVGEALAAARRIMQAVKRFHESRRSRWGTWRRRILLGVALLLVAGLSAVAIRRFAASVEGLTGVYYSEPNFQKPVLRRVDRVIDFDWGYGSPGSPLDVDRFSVEWSGTLLVPETGEYVFYLTSDDGSRLYLDGKLVIDYWGEHSADQLKEASVTLTKGRMPIRLRYFENAQRAVVKLSWSSKRIPRAPIPGSSLRP